MMDLSYPPGGGACGKPGRGMSTDIGTAKGKVAGTFGMPPGMFATPCGPCSAMGLTKGRAGCEGIIGGGYVGGPGGRAGNAGGGVGGGGGGASQWFQYHALRPLRCDQGSGSHRLRCKCRTSHELRARGSGPGSDQVRGKGDRERDLRLQKWRETRGCFKTFQNSEEQVNQTNILERPNPTIGVTTRPHHRLFAHFQRMLLREHVLQLQVVQRTSCLPRRDDS